eukprot:3806050-Pyramimonas_sp.AAC.1
MPTLPLAKSPLIPGPAVEETLGACEGPMRGCARGTIRGYQSLLATSTCLDTFLSPSAQPLLVKEVGAREAAATIRETIRVQPPAQA